MTYRTRQALIFTTLMLLSASAFGAGTSGFEVTVLMDHVERPEYAARGTVYVEALRGKSYAVRLTNPLPYRVAVALSVDGLNSIDAKHTGPARAAKWVIDPYDSIVISGWQVNDHTARQFFFTGEHDSYGAALGKTANLGVIEAVFFREREPVHLYQPEYEREGSAGSSRDDAKARPQEQAQGGEKRQGGVMAPSHTEPGDDLSDDYAATGMGGRRHHAVERLQMDLEKSPAASVRIRYEFRPQLVKLGVFPRSRSTIQRREQARGFEGYCPEVR